MMSGSGPDESGRQRTRETSHRAGSSNKVRLQGKQLLCLLSETEDQLKSCPGGFCPALSSWYFTMKVLPMSLI